MDFNSVSIFFFFFETEFNSVSKIETELNSVSKIETELNSVSKIRNGIEFRF